MYKEQNKNEMALLSLLINNKESYKTFCENIGENLFTSNETIKLFKYIQKINAFNQEFNYNKFDEFSKEFKAEFDIISKEINKETDRYKTMSNLVNLLIEKYNRNKLKIEIKKINDNIEKESVIEFDNISSLIYNFQNKKINDDNFEMNFVNHMLNLYDADEVLNDYKFEGSMNYTLEGGLNNGEVMYLAGASGMFKTSYLINLIIYQVLNNKKCVFFSLEMPKKQIFDNIFSILFNENFKETKQNRKLDEEKIEMMRQIEKNLIVIDYSNMSVFSIHKTIKQIKLKQEVNLVFVDHLNILNYGKNDEYNGINEATKNFKIIAKEENLSCIVLTQLNRDLKTRKDKRPVLSDLRGSNAIAQDADFVYMLHREEYYYFMVGAGDKCPYPLRERLEGYFAKCRRGRSTKQYYEINLKTKKVIRELQTDFYDSEMQEIINEIEIYEKCLLENDSVETVCSKESEKIKIKSFNSVVKIPTPKNTSFNNNF